VSKRKFTKTPTDMKGRNSYLGAGNEQEDLKLLVSKHKPFSVGITEMQ